MSSISDTRAAVMLVTRNFPPLVGGMESVNLRLLQELAVDGPVMLCGPGGSAAFVPAALAASESPVRPLGRFFASIMIKSMLMACRRRPGLVIAGSGLTLPMAWLAARLSGARLAVYLHGLDIIAPSRIYQMFWPRFIKACDLVLVNSHATARLAGGRGVAIERIHVLHPGTSIPDLDPAARTRFRNGHGLGERPLLLSVGRLTRRKGLAEFVDLALPRILQSEPEAKLLVVGEEASDSLTALPGSERARILRAAEQAGVVDAVRFLGRLSDRELGDAYQAANLHVFPVLELAGDVEGFGMVALESAAHGLRTVAFAVGGVPDAVRVPGSGELVPSGNYAAFADSVVAALRAGPAGPAACRAFAEGKSWQNFGTQVRALVRGVLGDG
jgi:phosphatidylinositol alpha-1,6-mannosyltransferase